MGHLTFVLKLESFEPPPENLRGLDDPFSEEEVKTAINNLLSHKVPVPDGFTMEFFQSYWDSIKEDAMRIINHLYNTQTTHFQWFDSVNIVLLPKEGKGLLHT